MCYSLKYILIAYNNDHHCGLRCDEKLNRVTKLCYCVQYKNITKKKCLQSEKFPYYNTISARINVIVNVRKKFQFKNSAKSLMIEKNLPYILCKNVSGINFVGVGFEGTLFYFRIIEIGFCIPQMN